MQKKNYKKNPKKNCSIHFFGAFFQISLGAPKERTVKQQTNKKKTEKKATKKK